MDCEFMKTQIVKMLEYVSHDKLEFVYWFLLHAFRSKT